MAQRDTNRLKIKRTVEQAVPMMDIDVTKVLSDEETAELHRQMAQRASAVKLAAEVGRAGLRDRLNKTIMLMKREEET